VIRFSAALVIVGLGLLLAGAIASNMTLVYAAIAVSVCAGLVLVAGMIVGRDELFGRGATTEGAERTFDRGVTPGPGTAAIPGAAAGAGVRRLGDRNLAAVSAQAGPPGPSYTGVGWPDGQSTADELWARVDAELAAAGAPSREPKLTKESSSDEIWGRVEQELGGPAPWKTPAAVPGAEEAESAEREPAAEPAGQPDWPESAAWPGLPGPADRADHAEELVVLERADSDAESSVREASVQEAGDQEADAEVAPDLDGAASAGGIAASGRTEAAPDAAGAAPARDGAVSAGGGPVPEDGEAAPDAAGAAPGRDEAASASDFAVSGRTQAAPDAAGAAPDRDEAASAGGAASGHAEAAPDAAGAAPGRDEAASAGGGAVPEDGEAAPDRDGTAPDVTEAANGTRAPGVDANPAGAAPAADSGGDPGAELLAAPLVRDTSSGSYASRAAHSPTTPYSPAAPHSPAPPYSAAAPYSPATPYPPATPYSPYPSATQDSPGAWPGLGAPGPSATPGSPQPGRPAGPGAEPGLVIVVSGVPRYHRPECILIRFLGQDDVESVTREAAEASGCVPCRACQPD
jgi:hypothetical protein